MKKEQQIQKENVKLLFDSPYLRLAEYAPGKHYYDATRRTMENLTAVKTDEEFRTMLPDAASCIVILELPGQEPCLLLTYEYRYPTGRFLLSVPAGLMDESDREKPDPVLSAAAREIREETGLEVAEGDTLGIVNPLLFSTPGMTDESNALVCALLHPADLSALSQEGAEGTELFDGFCLLTKAEAEQVLEDGRDEYGNYYSLYTWAALMYFVSDLWRKQGRRHG